VIGLGGTPSQSWSTQLVGEVGMPEDVLKPVETPKEGK
jgi:hypothetical protein